LNLKSTILIVDDDPMNLMILRELLEDDYELIEANDGLEAIELVKTQVPCLVLMDIMMPNMNGYDACQAIRESPFSESIHIILISAKASAEERVRGYSVGADDYVVKPFDHEELLAKVQIQLKLRQTVFDLAKHRAEIACDNQELHNQVEETNRALHDARDLVVFALARLADSRDPETGAHLERIRAYCKLLCEELRTSGSYVNELTDRSSDDIYRASPLHDIGKVGVPDAVLLKPGKLTPEEYEVMKTHCNIGAQALRAVATHGSDGHFLDMAIDIAQNHHEKWDGSGYPNRIKGNEIPLSARICAVADVFDALTTKRVYKPPFSLQKARSIILEGSGSHFDPVVVDAFERAFERVIETYHELADAIDDKEAHPDSAIHPSAA